MRLAIAPPRAAGELVRARGASSSAHWRGADWCAVDVELTGLHRAGEIIAIGAVPIRDGRVILGEVLYTLARPSQSPRSATVLVHKLRSVDLAAAPPLDHAIGLLLETMRGCVPVFHTAAVERRFLGDELRRRRVRIGAAADTEALGRLWLRARDGSCPPALRLAALARALGQPADSPHHALADALTTAQAFISVASLLDAVEPQTVALLVGAEGRLRGARRFGPA
jgi:DNA polymerase III subunit epsilon